jgi:hypothetical protein
VPQLPCRPGSCPGGLHGLSDGLHGRLPAQLREVAAAVAVRHGGQVGDLYAADAAGDSCGLEGSGEERQPGVDVGEGHVDAAVEAPDEGLVAILQGQAASAGSQGVRQAASASGRQPVRQAANGSGKQAVGQAGSQGQQAVGQASSQAGPQAMHGWCSN